MAFEYYKILGLEPRANIDAVKKAYKKLAIEHHPDKGGDQKKFQEISNAYNILSNNEKKQNYDKCGDENPPSHNDMFHHFFNNMHNMHNRHNQQPMKCKDIQHTYNMPLEEAFIGCVKNITMKIHIYCLVCLKECSSCNGSGSIKNITNMGPFTQIFTQNCHKCNGSGSILNSNSDCEKCKGKGNYEETKNIKLNIPAGVSTGYSHKFNNCGEQPKSLNMKPGNLILNVVIGSHKTFNRIGNDLHIKKDISLVDTICGIKFKIDILGHDYAEIDTQDFGIIEHLKKYEIKNKGMSIINSSNRGNLIIEFNVKYPSIDKDKILETREFLEKVLTYS